MAIIKIYRELYAESGKELMAEIKKVFEYVEEESVITDNPMSFRVGSTELSIPMENEDLLELSFRTEKVEIMGLVKCSLVLVAVNSTPVGFKKSTTKPGEFKKTKSKG
jgi:hypothetical protein